VPVEFSSEAIGMLKAGAIVSAVAVPLGLLGWAKARAQSASAMPPRVIPWRVPWGGFEVFAAFLICAAIVPDLVSFLLSKSDFFTHVYGPGFPSLRPHQLPPAEASAAVAGFPAMTAVRDNAASAEVLRQLWARTLALPAQIGLLLFAIRILYPAWRPRSQKGNIGLAVAFWAVLTPSVLIFNVLVNLLFSLLDTPPESHQLTGFVSRVSFDPLLFLLQTCVAAPLVEEVLFRGLLLPWVIGARDRGPALVAAAPVAPVTSRPWIVMILAVAFSALTGKPGPVIFATVLAVGMAIVWVTVRRWKYHVRGVYAAAAMFAMVHSAVWPSPVPLFLLGLGLGWCAVRTRGVLVPAIVHGLFNAVSAVYVLRGGAS